MTRPKYVASCSGGKDSVATLLLAAQHNEPLDEAVFSEVMFDKDTSGEIPEHRDFIYDRLKPFCEKELGVKFTILHADKTYDEVFHHVITRGPHKGEVRGFAWAGMCAVNRDCKIPPVRKYNAALSPDTVSYVGIAADEPKRIARLDGITKVSLLAKYGMTEADAYKLCQEHGLLAVLLKTAQFALGEKKLAVAASLMIAERTIKIRRDVHSLDPKFALIEIAITIYQRSLSATD